MLLLRGDPTALLNSFLAWDRGNRPPQGGPSFGPGSGGCSPATDRLLAPPWALVFPLELAEADNLKASLSSCVFKI